MAVSSPNCEFSDIIAVRCTFENASVCYDVNTNFTRLLETFLNQTVRLYKF